MYFAESFVTALALALLPNAVTAGVAGSYSPPKAPSEEAPKYGSISYVDKPAVTFHYTTPEPDGKNWVGIWHAFGGGPENKTRDEDAVLFKLAPEKDGTVFFNATEIDPGAYKAYFLKDDYKWLADPITFAMAPKETKWYSRKVYTRPARRGEVFEYDVSNLVNNAGAPGNKYGLVSSNNGGWARITPEGMVRGTPGSSAKDTKVEVQVTTSRGLIYFTDVHIPVRPAGVPLVEELKVMTLNMWNGGTMVNNYQKKQLKFILEQKVDIIGLQETQGYHANRLAHALGWWSVQTKDAGIISKFPLEEITGPNGTAAARIKLDGDKQHIMLWSSRFANIPYGPHDFCFLELPAKEVMEREAKSGRVRQAEDIAAAMEPYLHNTDKVPIFFTGSLNSPSHQDWTSSTKNSHCGIGEVKWAVTEGLVKAGLTDSFREAHPDPVKDPGNTWSPIFTGNMGMEEPRDRIDYIFHRGATVSSSEAILVRTAGRTEPKNKPDHKNNDWTSDHRAVLSIFKLIS